MNLHLKSFPVLSTLTFVFLLLVGVSFPQAGQIDSTFGQDGKVMTSVNVFGFSNCRESIMQPDGKIISVGYSDGASFNYYSFAVARSNPDGTQDVTFGTNGIVVTQVGVGDAFAQAVTLQSDGKIVAAGNYDNGSNNDFILIRYLTDGTVDSTFGTDGLVTTQLGTDEGILSVTIQNDGGEEKIVAAGYSDDDFAIARYNSDGSLDNSFGNSGIKTTQVGNGANFASDVVIQNVGGQQKILGAGRSNHNGDYDFAAARFNSDGSLDNSFGTNGIVITPIGTGNDFAEAVAIQDDNKIVVGGYSFDSGGNLFALVRYDENGAPDNSFGTNGIVTTSLGINSGFIHSLAIQNDGKIIAGGQAYDLNDFDFAIARYNTDGSLDNSFGNNGIVVTSITPDNDFGYSVILQNTEAGGEKIIASGESFDGKDIDFILLRYETDGNLDLTFGTTGIQKVQIGNSFTQIKSVAIQSNGKIVAAGYTQNAIGDADFLLMRFNSDGSLDDNFGINGIVTTSIGPGDDRAYSVVIQSFAGGIEKLLLVGESFTGSDTDFALARYNNNGFLDNTFGSGGVVTTKLDNSTDRAISAAIQLDNRIVVAGYTYGANESDFAVVRYDPNGSLDNTFGTNGIVTTQIGNYEDIANSVKIQNDDKIVVSGYFNNGSDYDFAVVRYTDSGELDNTFGTNGVATTDILNSDDESSSGSLQSDGKILLAGYSDVGNGGLYEGILVRYNTDGSLDNSFSSDGIITMPISNSDVLVYSIVLQQDGKVLAAGDVSNNNNYELALWRYNSNGSTDNTFGSDGVVFDRFGIRFNYITSLAVQNDTRIIAAGYASESNVFYSAVALTRYHGDKSADVKYLFPEDNPAAFSLEQNYPNPFNPGTKIKFAIPYSSFHVGNGRGELVTLKVYDILGKEVSILVNEELPAGEYEVEFDASELSSGIYFYSLQTANFIETKKMILLK